MTARYPFVVVELPASRADEIGATLFELGASGVEERDDTTLARGPGSGRVTLVASFSDPAAAGVAAAALRNAEPELAPRVEEIEGDAWRDEWKKFYTPFALCPRITVAPPWVDRCAVEAPAGGHVLVLEPGRAFGTGLHATTSLVAEVLDAIVGPAGGPSPGGAPASALAPFAFEGERLAGLEVLDVGTGSGILAFVALLLGAPRVIAIDIDPEVVEVVRENAERNGLADRIDVRACTVADVDGTFPLVLANIESKVLDAIAPALVRKVAAGGLLVSSGILAREAEAIARRYASLGLVRVTESRRGEQTEPRDEDWTASVWRRP